MKMSIIHTDSQIVLFPLYLYFCMNLLQWLGISHYIAIIPLSK